MSTSLAPVGVRKRKRSATSLLSAVFGTPVRHLLRPRRSYVDETCEHCCAGWLGPSTAYEIACDPTHNTYRVFVVHDLGPHPGLPRYTLDARKAREFRATDTDAQAIERARQLALHYVATLGARRRSA